MAKQNAPKVRVAYKPLVRKGGEGPRVDGLKPAKSGDANAAFIRAANEDDDGYDPYSDRREVRPFFEENPWD